MALSSPVERLQPCLFDRLIDDEPDQVKESRAQRIISLSKYREAVQRDLVWLLNTGAHTDEEGLDEFPEVAASVLNFGMKALSGLVASGVRPDDMEDELKRAIRAFEPRVVPETLSVKVVQVANSVSPNVVSFEITGELWAQPFPEKLFLKTALDIESGTVVL